MTDDEIDKAINVIRAKRATNNDLFCDWLAMSFKCPNCRLKASAYQQMIRMNDVLITKANRPLARLWRKLMERWL